MLHVGVIRAAGGSIHSFLKQVFVLFYSGNKDL